VHVRLQPTVARTDVIWKFAAGAALIGGGVFLTIKANEMEEEIARDMAAAMDTGDKETQQKAMKYGGWATLGVGGNRRGHRRRRAGGAARAGLERLVIDPRPGAHSAGGAGERCARRAHGRPGYAGVMATGRF
jgi:hypothetical protein